MVWFVRYLFEGEARRYRIGEHPETGLSGARKMASVVRGRAAAGEDPQAEKRAKREAVRRRRMGLPPQAVALLAEQRSFLFAEGVRSEYVFATSTGERPLDSFKPVLYRLRGRRSNGLPPSKDKRAKRRTAVLPDDVTVHDIRRTVADALLNRIGAPPWIVDHVVLGHARPKLLRTYMPTLPLGEARDALQKWGDELAAILERASSVRRARYAKRLVKGT